MIQESNFCIGPWSEIRILPDGRLNWCHCAVTKDSTDWIQHTDLDQYFQGSSVNAVRQKILSGQDVDQCVRCYRAEKIIDFSFRQRRNVQMAIFHGAHFSKSLAESNFQIRVNNPSIKPYFYNIVLGNICNLACMMCNEDFSSRLATDFKRINVQHAQGGPVLLDWTQDDSTWKKFTDHIDSNPDIVCVHFQGGEPLIHRRFTQFIDHCIDTGHTDFHLTMVTNGTVYDSAMIAKFKKFRSCQVEISIETASKSNDYVRYPSNTQKILKNIEMFLENRDKTFDVVIRTVPNLLSLPDYDTILKFCLLHNVVVDSNVIDTPEHLKPAVWPDSVIRLIENRLQEVKNSLKIESAGTSINLRNNQQIHQNILQNIDLVLNSLHEPLTDKHLLQQQAREYIQKLDQLRNINVLDYCPEASEL
jgi:sulfatase maturation enzyme AslB (radical SAM superfamily)